MGEMIELSRYLQQSPDLKSMDKEELLACLVHIQEQIAELDTKEPKNMNSEAYEDWGNQHEELEDLADEVMDLLDELE